MVYLKANIAARTELHPYDVDIEKGTLWEEKYLEEDRKGAGEDFGHVNIVRLYYIIECKYNYTTVSHA